ncbi:hypothetical protein, conserved [Leishmania donovani]|uniref:Uncharacterized protein n=1 Tax=Leishmania donovani TaxID=5661 RepID=E9BLI9_LEIDO|nr:hypothetical protein, conserved [Leishmania donovani]TPP45662.1 hypothetical protein CGC21_35265 [Leishmania donovani]CBZ36117.1 hypothetical protein, conserved [Leishmania donovani]
MEDSPPPQPREVHIDLCGIEGDAPQPPAPHFETPNGTAAEPPREKSEESCDAVKATQHSSPAAAPSLTASHNGGNSTNDSPQQSIARTRLLTACGDANGAPPGDSRPSLEVIAASSAIPVRGHDSIRPSYLLKSPHHGATNGNAAAAANGEQATAECDVGGATRSRSEMALHRSASQARRRQVSTPVLARSSTSNSQFPFKTALPVSPEPPEEAGTLATSTQEDVKRYVHAVMEHHTAMLAAWDKRVYVAEVYRDKPLRTGGRPAPVRPQDRGFLERVEQNLDSYLRQLEFAKSLLAQSHEAVPPTKSGQKSDVKAWQGYCSRLYFTLSDLTVEENLIRLRMSRVLRVGHQGFKESMSSRTASPWGSRARGMRSYSRESTSARASSRPASRGSSKPATPRQKPRAASVSRRGRSAQSAGSTHSAAAAGAEVSCPSTPIGTNGSPSSHSRHAAPSSVVRRGNGVIRPGHSSAPSPAQASAVSVDQPRHPGRYGGHSAYHTAKSHTALSSAPALTLARQRRLLIALHPDTVLPQPSCTGNTYDSQTPYGRLSPQRRTVSPAFAHSFDRSVALLPELNDDDAESHSAAPSCRSLERSSAHRPAGAPPQLRTYSSPRGTNVARAATSSALALHPLRHRQLLEKIERYEKNAAALQPSDLQLARACFYELYGEPMGLHQYCQWIDDVAIKILRGA